MLDISYELACELRDAGFPQDLGGLLQDGHHEANPYYPTLEELIEELGEKFFELRQVFSDVWHAVGTSELLGEGTNPKIALINLYLALKRK